jgi:glutamate synthase domain-containing protein 3
MMRKCHLGTCPVGIATQDPDLRNRFMGKPEDIINFMNFIAEDVRQLMAKLGFRKMDELIGRVDLLETRQAIEHYKGKHLDLSGIFKVPDTSGYKAIRNVRGQSDLIAGHKDWMIIDRLGNALTNGDKASLDLDIANTDRTIGTILSHKIVKRYGAKGLPDHTIRLNFKGSAGQSFGAFLAPGITLNLIGDANDYLGKGLSGGKIIVSTPEEADYVQYENIIAGNTLLYGATKGEVFINGLAGERFAVRNSGATAVVEGVGDHGCEYMTGGVVVVLGQTGRNFAAGMSGGIAYVLDEHQLFDTRCNLDMVDLESVWLAQDVELLRSLIRQHHFYTKSERAEFILNNWRHRIGRFVKVIPIDYRRAMERIKADETRETECIPATEEVYR